MDLNNDENLNNKIIKSLQQLKNIDAPDNFEADLMRKINSGYQKQRKTGFWHEFLMPKKLIPTAALTAVLIVMYMLKFDTKSPENPLSVQPRIREDIVASNGSDSSIDDILYNRMKKDLIEDKNSSSQNGGIPTLTGAVIKEGLNFRQANITKSQRKEVVALKQKFESMVKNYRENESTKY